jgi:signal transduction histidine kinase
MLLMNILTNAIKYNASPKPRVDISFAREDRSLMIRFRDNGIGILKEERKQIFRKFYRGRRDDRIPVSGSGIGLYLVQQIAKLHYGRITADSEGTDEGSVFTLILPYDKPEGNDHETDGKETGTHRRG